MEKRVLTRRQARRGFLAATIIFLAVFASTAIPIPLYSTYQETIGLTTTDISNTMLTYLVGVVFMLLFAGRISDALGRKPVTIITIMFAIVGCVMFMGAQNAPSVLAARFVQGITSGLSMSAISTLVIDCASYYHLSWGSIVSSCGPMFGIMLGSLGVGALFAVIPSITVAFALMIAILLASMLLMIFVPEPIAKRASFRASLKVRFFVPKNARLLYLITGALYVATWSVGCFFQSFSAPIATSCFDATTPLLGSAILATTMAPSVLGDPLTSRLRPSVALRAASVVFLLSCVGLTFMVDSHIAWLYLVVCVIFSLAMGSCVSTSLRMLLLAVDASRTSAIVSSVNLTAYIGSAIATVLTGMLLNATSYFVVFAALTVLAAVVTAGVLGFAKRFDS